MSQQKEQSREPPNAPTRASPRCPNPCVATCSASCAADCCSQSQGSGAQSTACPRRVRRRRQQPRCLSGGITYHCKEEEC